MQTVQDGARRQNGLPVCGADSIFLVASTCGGFTTGSFRSAKPYENTFECWQKLCVASRDARHLELVPADWWSDKKSTTLIHLVEPAAAEVTLEQGELSAMTDMPEPPRLQLIPPTAAQPYHIELWCEKTTINDILLSLDEQYGGLNIITGEGELS
jgi:hypothetical protein